MQTSPSVKWFTFLLAWSTRPRKIIMLPLQWVPLTTRWTWLSTFKMFVAGASGELCFEKRLSVTSKQINHCCFSMFYFTLIFSFLLYCINFSCCAWFAISMSIDPFLSFSDSLLRCTSIRLSNPTRSTPSSTTFSPTLKIWTSIPSTNSRSVFSTRTRCDKPYGYIQLRLHTRSELGMFARECFH